MSFSVLSGDGPTGAGGGGGGGAATTGAGGGAGFATGAGGGAGATATGAGAGAGAGGGATTTGAGTGAGTGTGVAIGAGADVLLQHVHRRAADLRRGRARVVLRLEARSGGARGDAARMAGVEEHHHLVRLARQRLELRLHVGVHEAAAFHRDQRFRAT